MKLVTKKNYGFTLIELLLVVLILVLMGTLVVPRLSNLSGSTVKSETRKFGEFVRQAYNQAATRNQIHRILLDIDNSTYRIEYLEPPPDATILTDEEKEKQEEEKKKKEESNEPKYALDIEGEFKNNAEYCELEKLPSGIKIYGVHTFHTKEVAKQGQIGFLFFPNGFVEKAIIYLTDSYERIYTIKINQLTGGLEIFDEYKEPNFEE